ncbi:MAG: putative HTH-type transcriptional regulator [Frankiales bacterium]|nr:putative HTH-type transcriptional regulator [Frankiales bacterium]
MTSTAPAPGTVSAPLAAGRTTASALTDEQRLHVDALIGLLGDSETLDVRVTDVVRAAGSCNAAFYRAFPSKDALLLAASLETARRTAAATWRRLPPEPTPAAVITAWAKQVLRQAATPAGARAARAFALDRHRLSSRFPNEVAANTMLLTEPLRWALAEAGVRDLELVLEAICEMVLSLQASAIAEGRTPTAARIRNIGALCLRTAGLGA